MLLQLILKTIKREVEDELQDEFGEDVATEVVAEEIVNVEEVTNNVIDSIDDTRHILNDKHRKIIERLYEIMLEEKQVMALCLRK